MILIDIENPTEIAEQESTWLRLLGIGRLAPDLVRRKVEARVAETIREGLSQRGIRAKITLS